MFCTVVVSRAMSIKRCKKMAKTDGEGEVEGEGEDRITTLPLAGEFRNDLLLQPDAGAVSWRRLDFASGRGDWLISDSGYTHG
jgi:hypothetical protein